jgi:hypothetical protein
VDGGPVHRIQVEAEVTLAGTDRVAIYAVGSACSVTFGCGAIYQQEQIARAVALRLSTRRPEQIEMATDYPARKAYATQIQEILSRS